MAAASWLEPDPVRDVLDWYSLQSSDWEDSAQRRQGDGGDTPWGIIDLATGHLMDRGT
jgi:hypothetical protein